MSEYRLCNHPNEDQEWNEALAPCERCGATPGGAEHNCYGLKPMSLAPMKTILAMHFEKGPVEIRPDLEANWWLHYARPGVTHWFFLDDDEGGSVESTEFHGWAFESAE